MGTTGPGKPVVSAAPCRLGQADLLETLSLQLSYQQLVDFWSVTDRACVPAAHHHRAQLIGFSQVQSQSPCLPRNLLQGPIDQQFGHMEAGYNLYKHQGAAFHTSTSSFGRTAAWDPSNNRAVGNEGFLEGCDHDVGKSVPRQLPDYLASRID